MREHSIKKNKISQMSEAEHDFYLVKVLQKLMKPKTTFCKETSYVASQTRNLGSRTRRPQGRQLNEMKLISSTVKRSVTTEPQVMRTN